jgi:hypothetical protein
LPRGTGDAASGASAAGPSSGSNGAAQDASAGDPSPQPAADVSVVDSSTALSTVVDSGSEGVEDAPRLIDSAEAQVSAVTDSAGEAMADVAILCGPAAGGSYFVDPIAGRDGDAFLVNGPAPAGIDLGNPAGLDYGRNVFLNNQAGDICMVGSAGPTVLAAGNIFGAVDCAVGGKLNPAVTCGNTTSVTVSNCTF